MPTRISICSILILLCFCTTASAKEENKQIKESIVQDVKNNPNITTSNLETYHLIQEILNDKLSNNNRNTTELELKIKAQEHRIKTLEKQISTDTKTDDGITTTIVLASVTVVVTVLGVLMAILSIFGYTNIKQEATKASKETALSTVKAIAEEGLLQATERSILSLIEKGRFDEIIQNSISSIEYRGISIDNDPLDEEDQN